tara:strand:+ start:152 stop:349 length:198 start_codon:yes stop_codon:yes gene_type:complete
MTLLSTLEQIINMQEARIRSMETEIAALRQELMKNKPKPKNFKKNQVMKKDSTETKLGIPEVSDN